MGVTFLMYSRTAESSQCNTDILGTGLAEFPGDGVHQRSNFLRSRTRSQVTVFRDQDYSVHLSFVASNLPVAVLLMFSCAAFAFFRRLDVNVLGEAGLLVGSYDVANSDLAFVTSASAFAAFDFASLKEFLWINGLKLKQIVNRTETEPMRSLAKLQLIWWQTVGSTQTGQ